MSQAASRRTFAIISHPDAGKTTLTERLLLAGGAIHLAGDVKARGDRRRARSDWMKIEQDRGISVTSSVMTFEHDGLVFNLLDTPGHEDFSEDTYRTLTAVDSAIMVIDAAKGIESQTKKLFEVCRLRDIPIMTFVNKLDRESRSPFELLDEIQDTLQLDIAPVVWPVGMGVDFAGCYDLAGNRFLTSSKGPGGACDQAVACSGLDDPQLDQAVKAPVLETAREEIELAAAGYHPFEAAPYQEGNLTPVVFGSALKDFGVGALLDLIAHNAPPPRPSPSESRLVEPDEGPVTGFVFKVQANMDKNHRDRVAFLRVCSGHFKRGMKLRQVRTGKDVMVHSPIFFLARDRTIAEDAGPGDIVGLPNHGTIRVGDTFTEGERLRFTGLPAFAPELLRRVFLKDTTKLKQLRRALMDFAEEGLIQVFKPTIGAQWIVGVIGQLQFDVIVERARQEYKIEITFEPVPYFTARWLRAADEADLKAFVKAHGASVVHDGDDKLAFLPASAWELDYESKRNEGIEFLKTKALD
ncbi:MAG: peptide chain release factor 3 [Pseudomonadota bacterium]